MLPAGLRHVVEERLSGYTGAAVRIKRTEPVGGGSINRAVKLETGSGSFFLKFNSASLYPQMFERERQGLSLLRETGELFVPDVISDGEAQGLTYLLLEFINSGRLKDHFWENFGESLARLHRHSAPLFGLDHPNYIGSLEQVNGQKPSWTEFFIEQRLRPQVQMAGLSPDIARMFDKLYEKLDSLFPMEPPALLHGDLWSGNYMTSPEGKAALIDPAVYYGHREMDIGMSKLFGGFSAEFYEAYNHAYPMESGWESRVDTCNLYPLMVHVNLFGGSYLHQVSSILRKYTH